MATKCEICGKECKTAQGLRGHKTFVHDKASSSRNSAPQQLSIPVAQSTPTTGDLAELRADLYGVNNEVSELDQQLSLLADEVKALLTLRNVVHEQGAQYSQQLEQLRTEWVSKIEALEYKSTGSYQLLEKQLSATQRELSSTAQRVSTLNASVLECEKSVTEIEKAIGCLTDRIGKVEGGLDSSVVKIDAIKNKLLRQPTGKLVEVEIKGKTRVYKEYLSGKGLLKSHLQCDDLIFGKRWIDLAEPED